ncbi:MAG TPA: hypothetical protein VKH44_06935 [Pirellulaceae bacterium]|nr:hypothetical protein [Pirellulaceae bacterium]
MVAPVQFALIIGVPLIAITITAMAGIYVLRPLDRAAKKNRRFAPFTAVDHSVLQPMDRAAKKARPRTRFTIVDFLALTAHLSVPLALFAAFSRGSTGAEGSVTVLAGFGCFAAALIWWGTVQTALWAGITDPRKRFFMIALIVPITFCAAIVVGPLAMFLLIAPWVGTSKPLTVWPCLFEIGMIITLIVCRRTTLWILKAPEVASPPENLWAETES